MLNKMNLEAIKSDIMQPKKLVAAAIFLLSTLALTIILAASHNIQNISENGISKKDVSAKNSFEVVDTRRTEARKQEVAAKVRPVLVPIEDAYVRNNLDNLIEDIDEIKAKKVNRETKFDELSALIEMNDLNKERTAINYILNANAAGLKNLFKNTRKVLNELLIIGISDIEFQKNDIETIINQNVGSSVRYSQLIPISGLLEHVVVPNLVVDDHATEIVRTNAKNSVRPYIVTFKRGDYIIRTGEPVTQLKKDALKKAGYTAFGEGSIFGIFALVNLMVLFMIFYIRKYEKKFFNFRYMSIQAGMLILVTILTVITTHYDFFNFLYLLIPCYVMILAIFTTPILAGLSAILTLILYSVVLNLDQQFIFCLLITTITASYSISKINFAKRFDLVRCGLDIAFIAFCTNIFVAMFQWEMTFETLTPILMITLYAFFSGVFALGLFPVVEKITHTVSPYGLIELADHNQKLLATLQYKAPGTYHHSLMVANLCEAAAEAIGANPILARVGAFYHDIGKLKRPLFFIENQSYFGIENPHGKLNPRLSKMVITSHTKDGVELAKEYGLPQSVIDFIQQHHGESLAGHFYRQAIESEGEENVKEEQFRYPGPKPNTKETAILMLADAVESAVRSLKNPTQEEIENMISKIITERLNDGQLSDSPLTLKDIKLIAITFNRILRGMQHDRIKYQENVMNEFEEKNKIKFKDVQENKMEKNEHEEK